VPGHVAPSRLEAEVLASFILGASALVFLVAGAAAQPGPNSATSRISTRSVRPRPRVGRDGRGSDVVLDALDGLRAVRPGRLLSVKPPTTENLYPTLA